MEQPLKGQAALVAAAREVAGDLPLGRLGQAEELGQLVTFLVNRKAGFLTGSDIRIDGGRSRSFFEVRTGG